MCVCIYIYIYIYNTQYARIMLANTIFYFGCDMLRLIDLTDLVEMYFISRNKNVFNVLL